jgi:glycerophosphoryl diester phosphodiesterase
VIDLRRRDGRMLRIGHRGAAALAPENTVPALALALELGCDLVEFDVHELDGRLVLVHDLPDGPVPDLPTLDDALAFLAGTEAGVHLDLKAPGAEAAILDALRRHGVVERTMVSSFELPPLRVFGALEPALRLGLTYPQDRHGLVQRRAVGPFIRPALAAMRAALPTRIARMLRRAGAAAAVLNSYVVTETVVRRCHDLGAAVLVWTVDDPDLVERLDRMGVDGVITNDPRVFGDYTSTP